MVNSVHKGKKFQWKVARILAYIFNVDLEEFSSAHGGKTERDIQQSGHAKNLFPYHVECKHQRTLKIREWVSQAETDAFNEKTGLTPMVIFKFHESTAVYVIIRLEDFLHATHRLTDKQRLELRKLEKSG